MNKKILFSPVGGTDPISVYNYRDGSFLHICRHYKPDHIVLYMSREMMVHHATDNRYLYCLDRLAEAENWAYTYEIIQRPELTKVHDFDYFYQDFRGIIASLFEKMDDTDELYINISSGTPQMKSGLLVMKTLGEFPCRLIQVATPSEKRNVHEEIDNYPLEELWDLDEDNEEGSANRCKEVQCPSLSKLKNEEIIKKHIAVYDYDAAYTVSKMMPMDETKKYRELLKMAARRILLDFDTVDAIAHKYNFKCVPLKEKRERELLEYTLSLDVKYRRKEYPDFIRGITPIFMALLKVVLENMCDISLWRYTTNKKSGECWDKDKLYKTEQGKQIDLLFQQKYCDKFNYGNVYSDHIVELICEFAEDDILKKLITELRGAEQQIRNIAAHQIACITEEVIKEKSGLTSRQIIDKIKKLFQYTGIEFSDKVWNSYDDMNRKIIELMNAN